MKVIRCIPAGEEADRIIAWAKKLPGVQGANKYRVSGKYHCMIYGDISVEVANKFLDGHRNLAKSNQRV